MCDWVNEALVVSDPSNDTPGGVYVFDGDRAEVIDRLSTSGLSLAPGERLLRSLWSSDEPGSSGELLEYDSRGISRYRRLDGLADSHGVAWHDGSAVIASTATNEIVWLREPGPTKSWQACRKRDAWHLNDVLVVENDLYVCAFGQFSETRGWSGHTEGAGLVFKLGRDGPQPVLEGLTAPHSQRFLGDRWLVCNSGTRELLEFDESGRITRRLELRVWPRGMAISEPFIFVGESEHRYENTDPSARATIAVVDMDEWKVVERIEVPGKQIYDLVIVPRSLADSLSIGFRTNRARMAATSQIELFEAAGVKPARLWAISEPLPPADVRARIEATIPSQLPAKREIDLDVVLENRGSAILLTAEPNPVHLTYRWFRDGTQTPIDEVPIRSPLVLALVPGRPGRCEVRVATPHPGSYRLRLTLVQENVCWFDDVDPASFVEAPVEVVEEGLCPANILSSSSGERDLDAGDRSGRGREIGDRLLAG